MIASGDLFSAERFLARALQANPQHAAAHLNLGVISLLRGDLAAAYPELKLAQSLDPDGSIADQVGRLLEAYYGEKAP
jgi:Flp pilus assembly protein TadD